MQKKLEELEEKMYKIEFRQDMIEVFKKGKENKINDFIESLKENFSENFCGAAFIIFNTIKEKEDYLSQFQNNRCYRFIDIILIYLNIFYYFYSPYFSCCCNCGNYCCFSKKEKSLDYYKKRIKFERALEPEDIIFEILEVNQLTRFFKIILGSFLSLIICSISYGFYILWYFVQMIIDEEK